MKTRAFIIAALALCISQAAFSANKPKHHKAKDSTNQEVRLSNCSVSQDGTIRNNDGGVIGKLNADGTIVDGSGKVIGHKEETTLEKINDLPMYN